MIRRGVGSVWDRRSLVGGGGFRGFDAVKNRRSVEWGADEFFGSLGMEATMGGRGRGCAVIKIVVVGIGQTIVVPAGRVAVGTSGLGV